MSAGGHACRLTIGERVARTRALVALVRAEMPVWTVQDHVRWHLKIESHEQSGATDKNGAPFPPVAVMEQRLQ